MNQREIRFLDLQAQYRSIRDEIDTAIHGVLENSEFIGGKQVREFESTFAAFQEAGFCVGVGNGTDALEIAIEALDLPIESEIIVPANSFIATSEAVTRTGHKVVFSDINPDSYTLDIHDVERRISSRTAAIIAVHLYGHPCDMQGLQRIADRHGLRIIEDCAQAHGASVNGRRVGAIGDVGAFSFYPGKNLGAYGDAGAITTNDEALAVRCRMIANHGRIDKYNHVMEGRNSRLDGIQAAVLNVKLRHLEAWISRRNEIAGKYTSGLSGIEGLLTPSVNPGMYHAFHLYVVRLERREELKDYLGCAAIQTGIHYPIALPKLKAYSHLGPADEGMNANRFDVHLLSLPMGEHLMDDDVEYVISKVKEFHGV